MKAIKNPLMILCLLVLLKAVQAAYAFAVGETPYYLPYLRLTGLLILAPISYFAVKRQVAALRIMGVYLLSQILAVFGAIFLIPHEQAIFKSFAIVTSTYFVYGGYVLLQEAKEKRGTENR